jgi:hypothetical protein
MARGVARVDDAAKKRSRWNGLQLLACWLSNFDLQPPQQK